MDWGDFDEAELIRSCDEAEHRYKVQNRAREATVEYEDIFFDDDNNDNNDNNIQHRFKRLRKNHKDGMENEGYGLEDIGDLDDEEDDDDLDGFIRYDDNEDEYQEESGDDESTDHYLARIQAGHDPCAQADDSSFDSQELEKMVKDDPCLRVRLLPSFPHIPPGAKLIYRVATDGPANHDRVLVPLICKLCGIDYNKHVEYDKDKGHVKIVHSGFNVAMSWKHNPVNKKWQSYCICNQTHQLINFCSFTTSDNKLYYFQIGGTCYSYITNGMHIDYHDITDSLTKKRLEKFMLESESD